MIRINDSTTIEIFSSLDFFCRALPTIHCKFQLGSAEQSLYLILDILVFFFVTNKKKLKKKQIKI